MHAFLCSTPRAVVGYGYGYGDGLEVKIKIKLPNGRREAFGKLPRTQSHTRFTYIHPYKSIRLYILIIFDQFLAIKHLDKDSNIHNTC